MAPPPNAGGGNVGANAGAADIVNGDDISARIEGGRGEYYYYIIIIITAVAAGCYCCSAAAATTTTTDVLLTYYHVFMQFQLAINLQQAPKLRLLHQPDPAPISLL